MSKQHKPFFEQRKAFFFWRNAFLSFLLMFVGILGMWKLFSMRPAPKQIKLKKQAPIVQSKPLKADSYALSLGGVGTAESSKRVSVIAEISGRAAYVSAHLKAGRWVRKGEL
ncbi:MAG: hypothetical protein AAGJ35_00500, partial [Myxococcota bacterium]